MRNVFLCLVAAAALSACGGALRVRYDLLDSNYVKTAMLEQRIPEQIRIVRGICSGQKCANDLEVTLAQELIRQANDATSRHWDDIGALCNEATVTCTRPAKLDSGILEPQAKALQQVSALLNNALGGTAAHFDSNKLGNVPLNVREVAVARASTPSKYTAARSV